jgi:hypothetical protein
MEGEWVLKEEGRTINDHSIECLLISYSITLKLSNKMKAVSKRSMKSIPNNKHNKLFSFKVFNPNVKRRTKINSCSNIRKWIVIIQ